jgi:hypothetical protein
MNLCARTNKDFERMIQMLMGFLMTQIAGAVATYSIADHLAKGSATAEQIATLEGIDSAIREIVYQRKLSKSNTYLTEEIVNEHVGFN